MILYALTIFLSAFLLFQVQPLIGKYVLPWFGGTPAVWTTCMLVFQLLLLLGYAYAHMVSSRLSARRQALLHTAALALSLAWLPIIPSELWKPSGDESPTWRVMALVACSVGVPYFLLSTTSPLVQRWSATSGAGRSAYRLYALSNVGSLLALVSYPFLFEPLWPLHQQARIWTWAYGAFVLLAGKVALGSLRRTRDAGATEALPSNLPSDCQAARPTTGSIWLWLVLAACGSTMLLATTNQMCQEVAVVPFLWVLPLAIYLISFIASFENEGWYRRDAFALLLAVAAIASVYALDRGPELRIEAQVAIYSFTLAVATMICHGELAHAKPAAEHLTLFYLLVAAGGALGGVLVAVLAPLVFSGYWEFHLGLFTCCLLVLGLGLRDRMAQPAGQRQLAGWPMLGLCYLIAMASLGRQAWNVERGTVDRSRNFFGVLRVKRLDDPPGPRLVMAHGTTEHGFQFTDARRSLWPTTYYGPESGAGLALAHHPQRAASEASPKGLRIGLIGLGTGTLCCYARPGDTLRYYEINPAVVHLARQDFTFISESRSKPEFILGDGRMQLERELAAGRPQRFDVLVVDAFTSDAIPLHLLTRECFALYWQHLARDGLLVLNVSNRHVDLTPVVRGLAGELGKEALLVTTPGDFERGTDAADWLIVTSNRTFLNDAAIRQATTPWPKQAPAPIVWTDDYASLRQVLRHE